MKKLLILFIFIITVPSLSANMSVRLDRLYCLTTGDIAELPILLENRYPSYMLGGFDFLVEYDNRLTLLRVTPGDLLNFCGWEYFTYSATTPNSVRIIALAETNNGPNHPTCFADSSGTLALLRFQITSDPVYTNDFIPVWWKWEDCGDNSLSSADGNELYISDSVYYFNGTNDLNITQDSLFPTPYGAPSECVTGPTPTPIRTVDFFSGGFDAASSAFQVHCLSDIIAPNDSGTCGAIVTFEIPMNSNCPGAAVYSIPTSGSFFPIGTTVVTTIATDNFGHVDSCYFNITVTDTEPPQITTCQSDTTLYTADGEWWGQLYFDFAAVDICSNVTHTSSNPSGSYFSIGVTDVICIATDSSGNADSCLFSVTVLDIEPPIIQCPDTIFLPTESGLCGATADFIITATDNSQQVTVTSTVESGTFLPVGTTLVSATATDPYGNSDSCNFVIIIEDVEPPQIACVATIGVGNEPGTCGASVDFSLTATDNCGIPTLDYSIQPNSFFPIGSTLVVVTATDATQNIDSCQFYIVVQDIEPPQITVPSDIVLPSDFNQCGTVVDYSYTVLDNCEGYIVTANYETGSFFEVGSTLVLLEVTDIAGFTDSASFYVTVEDSQPPLIDNYTDLIVMSDSGFYGAIVEYAPSISENCQLDSVSILPPSGSYFEIGVSYVQILAVDIYGNFDSAAFSVSVQLQDIDNDQVADFEDNCVTSYNPQQEDTNLDGIGDACCCQGIRGNVNYSVENPPSNNGIDISDIVFLVGYMFGNPIGQAPSCPAEADIDGSGNVDISDIVFLVGYMFGDSELAPLGCP